MGRPRDDAQRVARVAKNLNTDQVRVLRCCARRDGTRMDEIKRDCLGLSPEEKYSGKFSTKLQSLVSRKMLRCEQDSRAHVYFITNEGREALKKAEIAAGVFAETSATNHGSSKANQTPSNAEGLGAVEAAEQAQEESQGFQCDVRLRKAVEDYAMVAAERHFRSLKYEVKDMSKTEPYDLRCEGKKGVRFVEVKGTQTDGKRVFLTAGEVAFAKSNRDEMVLFVLHTIKVSKDKTKLSGGIQRCVEPWNVKEEELTAISYKYSVPEL